MSTVPRLRNCPLGSCPGNWVKKTVPLGKMVNRKYSQELGVGWWGKDELSVWTKFKRVQSLHVKLSGRELKMLLSGSTEKTRLSEKFWETLREIITSLFKTYQYWARGYISYFRESCRQVEKLYLKFQSSYLLKDLEKHLTQIILSAQVVILFQINWWHL